MAESAEGTLRRWRDVRSDLQAWRWQPVAHWRPMTRRHVLPGFRLTMGFTVLYLCLIVLVPLSTLPLRAASASWHTFWQAVSDPRVIASYRLSITTSLAAAAVNAVFGILVAWVLV